MAMRNILLFMIVMVLLSTSSASAQFLEGAALLGAYLGVYQKAFTLFGQFRYGILRYIDLGLKMGMIDLDPGDGESNAGLTVGGDVKYWFMEQRSGDPLDVSIGVGTERLKMPDHRIFSLGGNLIASYQIGYDETKSVTPYGRLNIRWERQNFEGSGDPPPGWEKGARDDMGAALALGAELKFSPTLFVVAELEIDDNVGFVGGINYGVF
jgi:hypothetical protein